jgi:hypothetical protein
MKTILENAMRAGGVECEVWERGGWFTVVVTDAAQLRWAEFYADRVRRLGIGVTVQYCD